MNFTRRGFVGALIGLGAAPSLILPAAAKAEQRVQTATILTGGRLCAWKCTGVGDGEVGVPTRVMLADGSVVWQHYMHPQNWVNMVCAPGEEPIFTASHPLLIVAPPFSRIDVAWIDFDGVHHARSTQDGTLLLQ